MVDLSHFVHTLREHIEDWDVESKLRILRRQPTRRFILLVLIVIFLFYVFSSSKDSDGPSEVQQCVNDRLRHWSQRFDDLDLGIDHSSVDFIGNGHIGVDSTGELRFVFPGSRVLDLQSGFFPNVIVDAENLRFAESTVTDFQNGEVKTVKCFLVEGECACIQRSRVAHRTRPNVLLEEVQIINPTKTSLKLNIFRTLPTKWTNETIAGTVLVNSRSFQLPMSKSIEASVICSNAPGQVTVMQKREETFTFTCVVASTSSDGKESAIGSPTRQPSKKVVDDFSVIKGISSVVLLKEHRDAWLQLNSFVFHLSHSKAPSVLNGDRINATRYLLLSNVPAPTLEVDVDKSAKEALTKLGHNNERCFDKPSTLHYPSRLWQEWDSPSNLVKLADIWLLTLQKKGCSNFVKVGAEGVAQAFVLSLTANSFHEGHMEMDMAASELHREMSFSGIPVGTSGATVAVRVIIESDNRPYLEVSSTDSLFACDGGCLDEPVTLSKTFARLPIKVTKPPTSILYVATSRKHLEVLRSTIHVSEVGAAPAHEEEVLSLHRHGTMGGLPTSFWAFLGVVLIAFHVFLAKLLWSEWRKGDMTPYNPYLRNRYSYVRSH